MSTFSTLPLSPELKRSLSEMGFETPTEIQAQALPLLLDEPTDFLGLAATGTGKTAAFTIPLLEKIDPAARGVQGLILCPTRELALQVADQINLMGKHQKIRALPIFGGAGYGDQIYGLKQGATIVVGTPGRICDHLDKGTLKLDALRVVILDEADKMISMGFKEDLEKILDASPEGQSKIWLFSATMSREVRAVADTYLSNPKQVQANRKEVLSSTVEQFYVMTYEGEKPDVLGRLIDGAPDFYGIIFCQTKSLVADLTQALNERGYHADCLHGDMDQGARTRVTKAFRDRKVTILICTDVASRGLDVKDVTHVINYSIPRELEVYVHRIGRTARSGKSGIAISLVTSSHKKLVHQIERVTKSKVIEMRAPSPADIAKRKVSALLPTLLDASKTERYQELLDENWKKALSELTAEQVALRFLALRFPEVAEERKAPPAPMRREREREESPHPPRPSPNGVVVTLSAAAREQMDSGKRPAYTHKPRHEEELTPQQIDAPLPAPVAREERPRFEERIPKSPKRKDFEGGLYSDETSAHLTPEPRKKPRFKREAGPQKLEEGRRPFRKPAFGKPAFGKPAYGKPAYAKPAFGKPAYGAKSPFGKPAYGKPSYGKPAPGKPAFPGKPKFGKKPYAREGA